MKKVLSILISVAMIVTSVFCINFTATAADYDEGSIQLGENSVKASFYNSSIEESTNYWYSFTPSETQKYIFTSNCANNDLDPLINLYDENKEFLDNDDDGGGNLEFALTYTLEAGKTYYFVFENLSKKEIPITFTAKVYDISSFTFNLNKKHTLYQGVDSEKNEKYDENTNSSVEYDDYYLSKVIYDEGNTITINKIDGSSTTYTYGEKKVVDGDGYSYYTDFWDANGNKLPYRINYWTPQEEKPLQIGNNVECTLRILDTDVKFYIDIEPNPVASFEYIGNITVNSNDIYDSDYYDYVRYNYYNATLKDGVKIIVHYTDGTSETYTYIDNDFKNSDGNDFKYGSIGYYSNQSKENAWTPGGNNYVYFTYCGYEIAVPVTVEASAPTPTPTTVLTTQAPAPTTEAPTQAPAETTTQAPTQITAAQPAPVAPTQTTAAQQPVAQTTTKAAKKATTAKPKGTKIKKVKGSKKAIALTWAKVKGVKGYQIQVATDKKFKKNKKTVTIKKQKTTKTTVKKLKAKKTYYVRIRTYTTKKVNGKSTKVYSSWSKAKTVKTK